MPSFHDRLHDQPPHPAPLLLLRRDVGSGCFSAQGPARYFQGYRLPGEWNGVPQGVWAEWTWDGTELVVRNDRLGFSPMFWFANKDGIGVSPVLAELIPHLDSRELDDDALAVFLRFRSFIGEDTPFREIRALPPGATLRWSGGIARLEALGPIRFEAEPGARGRRQGDYAEVVRDAVGRALDSIPGRTALPLTGGLDSRLLLYSMLHLRRPPELCVTVRHHPPRQDEDAELAAELAREVGLPHVVLDQERDRLGQQLRNFHRTHLCTHEHAWYHPLPEYVRTAGFASFLDGIGGDLQAEPNYITQGVNRLMDAGRMEDAAASILKEGYLPSTIAANTHKRWSHERAVAHLVRHAAAFQGAADPWGNFRLFTRTRRNVALMPWSLHLGGAVGLAPFLDRSVVELLGPIPWQELADRTFRKAVLADAYPNQPPLPNEHADFSSTRDRRQVLAYGRSVARWAGGRLWRSPFLEPSFLPLRLVRAHLDRGYSRELPMACELSVYLLELARWAEPPPLQ